MSVRGILDSVTTALVALCAVVVMIAAVRREVFPPPSRRPPSPTQVPNWREFAVGDMHLGDQHTAVVITEFSDFECPFCAQMAQTLRSVLARHPGTVSVVYRNYPLAGIHPNARGAAIAAECAADVGKFAALHDLLFSEQKALGQIPISTMIVRAGITDTLRFARCVNGNDVLSRLRRDSLAATKLRIRGTPLVMVNDWMLPGTPVEATVESYVTRALNSPAADK